jgi:hypothetical protein
MCIYIYIYIYIGEYFSWKGKQLADDEREMMGVNRKSGRGIREEEVYIYIYIYIYTYIHVWTYVYEYKCMVLCV